MHNIHICIVLFLLWSIRCRQPRGCRSTSSLYCRFVYCYALLILVCTFVIVFFALQVSLSISISAAPVATVVVAAIVITECWQVTWTPTGKVLGLMLLIEMFCVILRMCCTWCALNGPLCTLYFKITSTFLLSSLIFLLHLLLPL